MVYRFVGKAVVKYLAFVIGRRYAWAIRIGGGLLAVAIGIAAYWANRDVPEG